MSHGTPPPIRVKVVKKNGKKRLILDPVTCRFEGFDRIVWLLEGDAKKIEDVAIRIDRKDQLPGFLKLRSQKRKFIIMVPAGLPRDASWAYVIKVDGALFDGALPRQGARTRQEEPRLVNGSPGLSKY